VSFTFITKKEEESIRLRDESRLKEVIITLSKKLHEEKQDRA